MSTQEIVQNEEIIQKVKIKLASMERRLGGMTTRLRAVSVEDFERSELLEEFAFARLYKIFQDVVEMISLILLLEDVAPPDPSQNLAVFYQQGIGSNLSIGSLQRMEEFYTTILDSHESLNHNHLYQVATLDTQNLATFGSEIEEYLLQYEV
jgi:hypothetical protein